jgi:site-specific DNA recombinase
MRTAVTYRRVSTGRQAEEGESLEAQQAALLRYCRDNDLQLTSEHEDAGKSGRSRTGRPGLEAAMGAVCKSRGVLVVYSLSRLARSIKDAAAILDELRACGADLSIVDMKLDTANIYGELIFNLIAAMAQFESQLIGQRTKTGHAHLRSKHGANVIGQPPYGYSRAKGTRDIIKHPGEQAILAAIRRWRKPICPGEPPTPYSIIAQRLNEAGHVTRESKRFPHGGPWTEGSVYRILNGRKKKAPAGGTHD